MEYTGPWPYKMVHGPLLWHVYNFPLWSRSLPSQASTSGCLSPRAQSCHQHVRGNEGEGRLLCWPLLTSPPCQQSSAFPPAHCSQYAGLTSSSALVLCSRTGTPFPPTCSQSALLVGSLSTLETCPLDDLLHPLSSKFGNRALFRPMLFPGGGCAKGSE